MRLVTYNIRFGWGLDGVIDLKRIADSVRGADIIALQEVERFWLRSGMVDQPAELANNLSDYYWAYGPAFDVDASEQLCDGRVVNRRRQFGTMVLSRWPILNSRLEVFPKLATEHCLNMNLGALECVIETSLGLARVYSLHLAAHSAPERLRQIEHLMARHQAAESCGGAWTGDGNLPDRIEREQFSIFNWSNGEPQPTMPGQAILLGDFNSEPGSPEYNRLVRQSTNLEHDIHFESFVDTWESSKERPDMDSTWWPDPPDRSAGRHMRLDYCYVTQGLSDSVQRVWIDQDAHGSDHKPYWIEIGPT